MDEEALKQKYGGLVPKKKMLQQVGWSQQPGLHTVLLCMKGECEVQEINRRATFWHKRVVFVEQDQKYFDSADWAMGQIPDRTLPHKTDPTSKEPRTPVAKKWSEKFQDFEDGQKQNGETWVQTVETNTSAAPKISGFKTKKEIDNIVHGCQVSLRHDKSQ